MLHHKAQLKRIDRPDNPNRCQSNNKFGQCWFVASEGSRYCPIHAGTPVSKNNEKNSLFIYQLAKYRAKQERLDAHTQTTTIKSLRDEVAILRLVIQTILNLQWDDVQLYSSTISTLIDKVRSLAMSCQKVESTLETMLDYRSAVEIAQKMIQAVAIVSPKTDFDALATEITELISSLATTQTARVSNYSLTRWQDELVKFATEGRVISLASEIGVHRMMLEDKLNSCHDEQTLIYNHRVILQHVVSIEQLVLAADKLEKAAGMMLNAEQAKVFVSELLTLLGRYVEKEHLESVANVYAQL